MAVIRKGRGARRAPHSALLWRQFAERLNRTPSEGRSATEHYVSTFSKSFNLASAPYDLHGRRIDL